MAWMIRRMETVRAGDRQGGRIGTSGKIMVRGLSYDTAVKRKAALKKRSPRAVFVIEQEPRRRKSR